MKSLQLGLMTCCQHLETLNNFIFDGKSNETMQHVHEERMHARYVRPWFPVLGDAG